MNSECFLMTSLIFDSFKVVGLLILQVKDDLGTAAELLALGVWGKGESSTSGGLPDILLIIVVLGNDGDTVCDEVCRVETNTELTNHGNISTCGESLHKLLGAGSCDRTEVVNEVLLIVSRVCETGRLTLTALV